MSTSPGHASSWRLRSTVCEGFSSHATQFIVNITSLGKQRKGAFLFCFSPNAIRPAAYNGLSTSWAFNAQAPATAATCPSVAWRLSPTCRSKGPRWGRGITVHVLGGAADLLLPGSLRAIQQSSGVWPSRHQAARTCRTPPGPTAPVGPAEERASGKPLPSIHCDSVKGNETART